MAKNRLKQLREKYNLSLKEVSEASTKSGFAVTVDQLKQYEEGKGKLDFSIVLWLAYGFDVSVPYFEGVADTRYPATTAAKS